MQGLFTYLLFDGNCAAALQLYSQVLPGTIETLARVGETPMAQQFGPQVQDRVIHARLKVRDCILMASDWLAPAPYPGIKGIRLNVTFSETGEAERVFEALAAHGRIEAPLGATPFARVFGTLTDRFGVPWQVMVQ